MTIVARLLDAIRRHEPKLTALVVNERPADHERAIKVAVVVGLGTAAMAVLNIVSRGNPKEADCDALVAALPTLVGDELVMLDHVFIHSELATRARAQNQGASRAPASAAVRLAYELHGLANLKRMLSMDKGPLGPIGGVATVLSTSLVPSMDQAGNLMLPSVEIIKALVDSLQNQQQPPGNTKSQSTGCLVATLAILFGGIGIAGGVSLAVWYFV